MTSTIKNQSTSLLIDSDSISASARNNPRRCVQKNGNNVQPAPKSGVQNKSMNSRKQETPKAEVNSESEVFSEPEENPEAPKTLKLEAQKEQVFETKTETSEAPKPKDKKPETPKTSTVEIAAQTEQEKQGPEAKQGQKKPFFNAKNALIAGVAVLSIAGGVLAVKALSKKSGDGESESTDDLNSTPQESRQTERKEQTSKPEAPKAPNKQNNTNNDIYCGKVRLG